MPHPLEQSYNWRTPVLFASIAAVICIGALAHGQANGWLPALIVVVSLWALIVGLIYLRTRAFLLIDGSKLMVRRFRTFHTIDAADSGRGRGVPDAQRPELSAYRTRLRREHEPHRGPGGVAAWRAFDPLHVDTDSSTAGNPRQGLPEDRCGSC